MSEFTQEQVDEMLAEATKKANHEAAGNRVALKEVQEQFAAITAANEAAKNKEAEEAGKFQELYASTSSQLEALQGTQAAMTERLQNYEAMQQKELESLLVDVPEEFKHLIKPTMELVDQLEMARTFAKTPKAKPPEFREVGQPQPNTLTNSVDKIAAGLKARAGN
jgi:hypothetical protein